MLDRTYFINNEHNLDFERLNLPRSFNGSGSINFQNEDTGKFRNIKYRLYKSADFSETDPFLILTNDITKNGFSISGNLRKWYFGWESTTQDLSKKDYINCINIIAKRLKIPKAKLWSSHVPSVEIGANIKLPKKYEFIIAAMISFPRLKDCKTSTETSSFKNRQREIISYNKLKELYDHKIINKRVYEALSRCLFIMRYEIKIKVASASNIKSEIKTLKDIDENWNTIIDYWENTFYKIKLNKIQNLKISETDIGLTRREFKDYCVVLAVQEYGIETIHNLINANFLRKHSEERKHVLELCKKFSDEDSIKYVQDVYDAVEKKACSMKCLS